MTELFILTWWAIVPCNMQHKGIGVMISTASGSPVCMSRQVLETTSFDEADTEYGFIRPELNPVIYAVKVISKKEEIPDSCLQYGHKYYLHPCFVHKEPPCMGHATCVFCGQERTTEK